jgi:hypothetical protein
MKKRHFNFIAGILCFLLFCLISSTIHSNENQVRIADLFQAAENFRASLKSGKIEYEVQEYIAPRPDLEINPEEDPQYANYRRGTIEKSKKCELWFKRKNGKTLWLLKEKNTQDLSRLSEKIIRKHNLNFNRTSSCNGNLIYAKEATDNQNGEIRDRFLLDRFPLEDAGCSLMFRSRELMNFYKAKGNNDKIIGRKNNIVEAGRFKEGAPVISATFNLEYGGRCLKEQYYKHSIDGNTGEVTPALSGETTFSNYQQIEEIWYPLQIKESQYKSHVFSLLKDEKGNRKIETNLISSKVIKILDTDFNISINDDFFTPVPEKGVEVYDPQTGEIVVVR